MTVSSNGTPTLTAAAFTTTSLALAAGAWPTGSSPVAGDLILAVVSVYGTTTGGLGSTPPGYTLAGQIKSGNTTLTAYYTKTATGSDSLPTFNGTESGTAADGQMAINVYDLSDSGGGTPVVWTDGAWFATSGTIQANSGPVPAGSLGVGVAFCSQGTTTNTTTWTTPAGWSPDQSQTATGFSQVAAYHIAGTTGNCLSALFTHGRTSTQQTALVIGVAPPGSTGLQVFSAGGKGSTGTNTATTPSFTPHAGELLAVAVGAGNGGGIAETAIAITDTLNGNAWSQLAHIAATASGGSAGVWCKDAGNSPAAMTVTVTITPTTVLDPVIVAWRFAGALPQASQNGAAGTGTGSTVALTPHSTGSLIVGGDGEDGTTAMTPNAATLGTQTFTGGAGDRETVFQGAAATTAGVGQTVGWSTSPTQNAIAAAEILPAPPAGGSSVPGSQQFPGQLGLGPNPQGPKWLLPPPSTPPSAAPAAPLTWLSQPVRAKLPQPRRARKGHGGRAGAPWSGQGPPVPPLSHPVRAQLWPQRKPRKGHGGRAGAPWSGTGPPLTPPSHPVQARQRQQPRAGRVVTTTGTWSGNGPPAVPLHQPVRDPLPPVRPVLRGRVQAQSGVWAASGVSGSGPQLTPLSGPVRSRPQQPKRGWAGWQNGTWSGQGPALRGAPGAPVRSHPQQPRRGRAGWQQGTWSGTGPAARTWHCPVRALPVRPVRGGHGDGSNGPWSGQGPAVTAPSHPARSRPQQPRRGWADWLNGVWASSFVPTSGPPLTPPSHPVQAQRRPAQGGRCVIRHGVYSGTGPPIRPHAQPIRAPLPPMRKPRRGHGGKSGAPYSGQGPPARVLHTPVRGPLRPRDGGQVITRAGTFVPAAPFTVGALTAVTATAATLTAGVNTGPGSVYAATYGGTYAPGYAATGLTAATAATAVLTAATGPAGGGDPGTYGTVYPGQPGATLTATSTRTGGPG